MQTELSNLSGDAILTFFSKDGSHLIYSSYWGGSDGIDGPNALSLDEKGNVYIAGLSRSPDFPLSEGAVDTTFGTYVNMIWTEGFVCKFHFENIVGHVDGKDETPSEFHILSVYPNPFNPSTTVEFSLPEPGEVRLTVYSITGQRVYEARTKQLSAGIQRIRWDGKDRHDNNLSSGVYLIRLDNGAHSIAQKVLLMK